MARRLRPSATFGHICGPRHPVHARRVGCSACCSGCWQWESRCQCSGRCACLPELPLPWIAAWTAAWLILPTPGQMIPPQAYVYRLHSMLHPHMQLCDSLWWTLRAMHHCEARARVPRAAGAARRCAAAGRAQLGAQQGGCAAATS